MLKRSALPVLLLLLAAGAAYMGFRANDAAEQPTVVTAESIDAVTTPLFSARRTPEVLQTPAADELLARDLEALSNSLTPDSCLVAAQDDREIYAHNGSLPLVPASTQKLLTALAVLDVLGPDHRYVTQVLASSPPVDGVLDGSLFIVGSGDPVLDTDSYLARYDPPIPNTDFEALAVALVEQGITEITGDIVGDQGRYDDIRYVESWPIRFTDAEQNQSGPLTALTVNDGFTAFADNPANRGAAAVASQPAVHAAQQLQQLLAFAGVTVSDRTVLGTAPPNAVLLAEVTSPPMLDIVTWMVSESDNTTAELLVKELGADQRAAGSTTVGTSVLADALSARGISLNGLTIDDGSGLSPDNRVTCTALVDLLWAEGPDSDLAATLAVAGETGTLAERFSASPAAGLLSGKTGSLLNVRSLAGFVETPDGEVFAYAIIENQEDITNDPLIRQELLGNELVEYPDGPQVDQLEPTGPVEVPLS